MAAASEGALEGVCGALIGKLRIETRSVSEGRGSTWLILRKFLPR